MPFNFLGIFSRKRTGQAAATGSKHPGATATPAKELSSAELSTETSTEDMLRESFEATLTELLQIYTIFYGQQNSGTSPYNASITDIPVQIQNLITSFDEDKINKDNEGTYFWPLHDLIEEANRLMYLLKASEANFEPNDLAPMDNTSEQVASKANFQQPDNLAPVDYKYELIASKDDEDLSKWFEQAVEEYLKLRVERPNSVAHPIKKIEIITKYHELLKRFHENNSQTEIVKQKQLIEKIEKILKRLDANERIPHHRISR